MGNVGGVIVIPAIWPLIGPGRSELAPFRRVNADPALDAKVNAMENAYGSSRHEKTPALGATLGRFVQNESVKQ
ncbi:hypothetical protein IVA87_28325 [Bradyrhizobium sp. 147]|uniref:hypothetical protein n=1 Tax=Bradyrhizobium sp. 147 TaxID=2782623 RepID=UPI001FF9837F|nr:hypothetical protein [Bradyrhizobium sp. 147]MCK1683197.1 hypothetical protein [Bradyrhizobium sp. 147]